MRDLATKQKISEFMKDFGRAARNNANVYLTGGATAVIKGWRETTIDIDLKFDPEHDELFRAIPSIKERLTINIELAAPSDFIPAVPGWAERCQFIAREGKLNFYHYDLYGQALSKIERGHEKDLLDVDSMFCTGEIDPRRLLSLFEMIMPELYRYPAVSPRTFAESVSRIVKLRGVG